MRIIRRATGLHVWRFSFFSQHYYFQTNLRKERNVPSSLVTEAPNTNVNGTNSIFFTDFVFTLVYLEMNFALSLMVYHIQLLGCVHFIFKNQRPIPVKQIIKKLYTLLWLWACESQINFFDNFFIHQYIIDYSFIFKLCSIFSRFLTLCELKFWALSFGNGASWSRGTMSSIPV